MFYALNCNGILDFLCYRCCVMLRLETYIVQLGVRTFYKLLAFCPGLLHRIWFCVLYFCTDNAWCNKVTTTTTTTTTTIITLFINLSSSVLLPLWCVVKMLRSITQCQSHVLCHLLKEKPTPERSLSVRSHNFILPLKDNRNFLLRALYHAVCPPPDGITLVSSGKLSSGKQYFINLLVVHYCHSLNSFHR